MSRLSRQVGRTDAVLCKVTGREEGTWARVVPGRSTMGLYLDYWAGTYLRTQVALHPRNFPVG